MPAPPPEPELEARASELVRAVLATPLSPMAPVSGYGDEAWRVGDQIFSCCRAFGRTRAAVQDYATDSSRRIRIAERARERGWARDVVELAWELIPYRTVAVRYGWEFWERIEGQKRRARTWLPDELARANYA